MRATMPHVRARGKAAKMLRTPESMDAGAEAQEVMRATFRVLAWRERLD